MLKLSSVLGTWALDLATRRDGAPQSACKRGRFLPALTRFRKARRHQSVRTGSFQPARPINDGKSCLARGGERVHAA